MQAWKIVIPTSKVDPEPRAHDGYEWIYVLSGHVRLVAGDRDWVIEAVADLDASDEVGELVLATVAFRCLTDT